MRFKYLVILVTFILIAGWIRLPIRTTVQDNQLQIDQLPDVPVHNIRVSIVDGLIHVEMDVTELDIPFEMDLSPHAVDGKFALQLEGTNIAIVRLPQPLVDQISVLLTPRLERKIDNTIRKRAGDAYAIRTIDVHEGKLVISLTIQVWDMLEEKF